MKVLYVSDLDGTLLNMNQELNSSTIKKLNNLIDKGINFTVSTGRGDSIRTILKDINFNLPVMILNGSLNYDFSKKEYMNKKTISRNKVIEIMNVVNNFGFKKFEVQTITNGKVKRFAVSDWDTYSDCLALNVVNNKEKMEEMVKLLEQIRDINFFYHKKVYSEDEWFCDITPKDVSKASSLKEFKEQYRFDKVIAFGDSENDLPLVEIADEFYAVENATDIVKKNATAVIGNCYDDGVADFISQTLSQT